MKLIIDIPEDDLDAIKYLKTKGWASRHELLILNGTPIPDNATNGDMINAMFDITGEYFYDEDRMVDVYGLDRTDEPSTFYADWWNAQYQKGGKE